MPKVLISDKLSPAAVEIFRAAASRSMPARPARPPSCAPSSRPMTGWRSAPPPRSRASCSTRRRNLKVVGRAGIGVDNVDVKSATARGVVVMNTPNGNTITTAEHAIAMMFALARQIPEASLPPPRRASGKRTASWGSSWPAKTLGLIGCGNIGSIVADRAIGLQMKVIAYDPFLSENRALDLGVEKVDLDALLARADFISLHAPLTEATRNILSRDALSRKPNAACGSSTAPAAGCSMRPRSPRRLSSGHIAGAALDVFETEPANESPLFGLENVVCTPHLGAATTEAQENVALQIAEQMSDFLLHRRGGERDQHAVRLRRGGAAAQAVHGAVPPTGRLRRAAYPGSRGHDPARVGRIRRARRGSSITAR